MLTTSASVEQILQSSKSNIMWQKCPVCNGTGRGFDPHDGNTSCDCKVCNGRGIINQLTGNPPGPNVKPPFGPTPITPHRPYEIPKPKDDWEDWRKKFFEWQKERKEPIRLRGCPNTVCFCTGDCMKPVTTTYFNVKP